jgi:hypothetical protein
MRWAYLTLKIINDVRAIFGGSRRIRRRVARRVYGKATGRLAARWFPPVRR